jgi:hypothetical protein
VREKEKEKEREKGRVRTTEGERRDSTYTRNADKDGALERSFAHDGCVAHRALNVSFFSRTRHEAIQMPDT